MKRQLPRNIPELSRKKNYVKHSLDTEYIKYLTLKIIAAWSQFEKMQYEFTACQFPIVKQTTKTWIKSRTHKTLSRLTEFS